MKLWSEFYPYMLPELPGVPAIMVDHALNSVAIDFMVGSGLQIADLAPIDIVAGTASYTLASPVDGTVVDMIKNAWYNKRLITYVSMDELAQRPTYWPDETGTPTNFTHDQQGAVILFPKPDASLTGGLNVKASLRPSGSATGIVDWIFDRYVNELAAGAKAKLMIQPGKSWSNGELAILYQGVYNSAKANARLDANRSLTRMSPMVNLGIVT